MIRHSVTLWSSQAAIAFSSSRSAVGRAGDGPTGAFPAIAHAIRFLPLSSPALDEEAVAHDGNGWPDFYALQSTEGAANAVPFAFDLLELEGEDLRARPFDERRAILEDVLFEPREGLKVSELFDGDGASLFRHACAFNLEGIVSKRRRSRYWSGRSDDWRKIKCPEYVRR